MDGKRKSTKQTQQFILTYKEILRIFSQIQDASTLNKAQIMDLVGLHKQNAFFFDKSLQQTYLKIFRCFQEKANKKIPTKFQTVADLLFKQLMKTQNDETTRTLNDFCDLLSEAIFSSIMNVRIMASRILFLVLKGLPNSVALNTFLTQKTKNSMGSAILFLVKQKVSTYRQLGIKLSSLVLITKSQHNPAIESQLFKILATEQNEIIRKMVMTNIPITKGNVDKLLLRLRDKNAEIRATLLRRLLTENYRLEMLKLNNVYKLLYDGYGTKDVVCKEEALRYFGAYFKEREMDVEGNKFDKFVELFQPNLLLVNPHLYILFNKLIGDLISFLPQATMCQYIRRLCNRVKSILKDKTSSPSISAHQLIWLKNASIQRPQIKQVYNAFQEFSPNGTQLSELLRFYLQKKNIFAMNEFLQMFSNIQMPDEIGRNRMLEILRETLGKLTEFGVQIDLAQISKNDDICNVQTQEQIKLKKLMLSYYDIPIISTSLDLILPIISAMKYLRPESYSLQLQQCISDFQNPDQHPIFNQKSTTELTLKSLLSSSQQKNKNKDNIRILEQKLERINKQIEFLKQKTIVAVTGLAKVQYDVGLDAYLPLIKEQLSKKDQSHGIGLLGLYCLQSVQKVNCFFPIFWDNIMKNPPLSAPQSTYHKQHLMISLKVMTDFIVKFNILNSDSTMNNTSTQQSTSYNSDTFMQRITHLILSKDPDLRIFSIECLCRMIYHNRVDENNVSTYFLYLLLLWWQTSSEEVSAKSVHTISLFFRSYLQKGNQQVKKLAQMLCVFHKILKIFQQKGKTINKHLIIYNLKINQLIKKTVSIATTVLRYHKQKKTIWIYQQPQLGPQQFFLLYLLYEPGFQNILQKPINMSDFYIKCPLETLLFFKKRLQKFQELVQEDKFFPASYKHDKTVTKKALEELARYEKQIQSFITVKNQETFNQEIINTLERIFVESCKWVNEEAKRIAKNIEDQEIFVNVDSDVESEGEDLEEEDEESEREQDEREEEEIQDANSQTESLKSEISSVKSVKMSKLPPVSANVRRMTRKRNQMDMDFEQESQVNEEDEEESQKPAKITTVRAKNRKRVPQSDEKNLRSKQPSSSNPFCKDKVQPPRRSTRARNPIF